MVTAQNYRQYDWRTSKQAIRRVFAASFCSCIYECMYDKQKMTCKIVEILRFYAQRRKQDRKWKNQIEKNYVTLIHAHMHVFKGLRQLN